MAKSKTVTIVNTGLCAIHINRERIMPDEEFEIPAEYLELDGIKYLFGRGELAVKDDSATTKKIFEEVKKKQKRNPDEGKTKAQLEDGGEF